MKERSQAQSDDLLDPLDKPVYVAPGDAEHVKTAHGDLDEQDAATLQIAEKHLDHGVGHEDDAEQQHKGAGQHAQAKIQSLVGHIHQAVHALEVSDDRLSHGTDAVSVSGEPCGEGSLRGDRQGVEPDGHGGEQADSHKALEGVDGCLLEVPPAGGVFDTELEG